MLIYKATSKTTGKVYIGQTQQSLDERIRQHKRASEAKQYHFYNAIRNYGFDDFMWEIVEDNINNVDLLNEREIYWINYYNAYEDGYNATRGGEGRVCRDDELILKLFIEGYTTKQICEITGYSRAAIYRCFAAHEYSNELHERKNLQIQLRCSFPVLQYDLEGNFIKEWPSATACNEIGNQGAISNVCRQEQYSAYGFLWKYKDDERDIGEWVNRNKNKGKGGKPKKKICQLNNNHEIINIYDSGAAAAKAMGLDDKSNICAAARKGRKCQGYYWKYIEE